MNPATLRWRVCSIWLIFFNWSLIVSMSARLRRSTLSHHRIRRFFMFLRMLVEEFESLRKEGIVQGLRNICPITKELVVAVAAVEEKNMRIL